jgi:SHS2 domain-containing protein
MDDIYGFREIEHTADKELEVWAPDLGMLLEQAARGMYAISGIQIQAGLRQERVFEIHYADDESMLVRFLSELLFLCEESRLAFDAFDLRLNHDTLIAAVYGAPVVEQAKEIKAVTYHNLEVRQNEQGLCVRIVFDV